MITAMMESEETSFTPTQTQEIYLGPHKLSLETLTKDDYLKHIDTKLPLYVSEICRDLDDSQLRFYLKTWFEREDFKNSIKQQHPIIQYECVSPKHKTFKGFKNRIQLGLGSNKSGKSGMGSYKIDLIGLNQLPDFPFKSAPGDTLYGWCCSENREMIEETPLKELMKWLREDQYELKRGNAGKIDKIIITADNGGKTEITLKPYEAGVKAFESSNLHFIWCDEPPPENIFQAMWARLTAKRGWLMITATTVQADSKYLRELAEGSGSLKELRKVVDVDFVEFNIWDNKTLSQQQINEFIALYPPGTPMWKIRVMGQYAELEGLVFTTFMPYTYVQETGDKITWNAYEPDELTEPMKLNSVRFDTTDYGKDKPFSHGVHYFHEDRLMLADQKELIDYTWFTEAELYEAGLEASQQAELIKQRLEEFGVPVIWVVDKQIMGDNRVAQGDRIVDIYREIIGEKLFPPVRGNEKDKRDPVTGLTKLSSQWVAGINKVTGKPRRRINIRCVSYIKEYMYLRWKPIKDMSTAKPGVTLGANHCIDPDRYTIASGLLDSGGLYQHYHRKYQGPDETSQNIFY